MRFEMIDDHSQLLDVFDDEAAALAGVRALLAEEPDAAAEVALMAFDETDDDRLVGRALYGDALTEAARTGSLAAMDLASRSHA